MTTLLDEAEDNLRKARIATSEGERIALVFVAHANVATWLQERERRDALAGLLARSVVIARLARNDGRRER